MRARAGRLARGTVTVVGLSLALGVLGAALAPGYQRPAAYDLAAQDWPLPSASPSRPVTTAELEVELRGTPRRGVLVTPDSPHAALVFLHGAGPGNAREARQIAQRLAAQGVAVLVADKITDGYSWRHRDYAALADDALAAHRALRGVVGVPAERVGLLGVSEGGWVATIAAARSAEPLGPIVLVSAPVVTPLEQSAYAATRRPPFSWPPLRRVATGALATGRPVVDYLDADVRAELPLVRSPVLLVHGVDDWTVPGGQAAARLRDGLPTPPSVLLAPGGHVPHVEGWGPPVAAWLRQPAGLVGTWSVDGAQLPAGSAGAPTPPRPTPFLDPRIHLAGAAAIAAVVGLARTGLRNRGESR